MTHHIAVVGKDPDDSAYGVWFPDARGSLSAADDKDEIPTMTSEVPKKHLHGEELPHARPPPEILQLDEVHEDVAHGDFLISVAHLPAG